MRISTNVIGGFLQYTLRSVRIRISENAVLSLQAKLGCNKHDMIWLCLHDEVEDGMDGRSRVKHVGIIESFELRHWVGNDDRFI